MSPHTVRLFGSPWSSPAWIKTNHNVAYGGFIIGQPGGRYYKIFARYFVKFIQEYAKNHITIWGITVENEPGAGFDKNYYSNSLGFNGSLERDFVKLDLGPELHAHGYTSDKFKVMIYDDNVQNQIGKIEDFVSAVLSDKEAEKYVSGIAYHWYADSDRTELERLHHKFPNQFILGTEGCELHRPRLGDWTIGEKYANSIIRDLNHFSAGWTDWNIALDPLGKPHWNYPDNPYLNSPVIVNASSQEYYKQPTFYVMGHFSKFIVPDSVRIHHLTSSDIETNALANVSIVAIERPDRAVVLTILNENLHSVQFRLSDPLNGHAKISVPANALQTFIWYS